MTRKELYENNPLVDMRTYVRIGEENEIAMKPYYYYRNGLLHIRYSVDRCIELTEAEQVKLKLELTASYDKQTILSKAWNFFTTCVGKDVIRDGIVEMEKRVKHLGEGNGRTY